MNLEFYKSKFEREQKRRVDLDNALNLPILVSTLVMGLNSYVIKEHKFNEIWNFSDSIIIILLIISGILIMFSSYYVFLAVNNLLKGFDYPNFDLMIKYREIEIFNEKCLEEENKLNLEEIIKDKLVMYADESTVINDRRGDNLCDARKFIIINFVCVITNILIVTSSNLLK